MDLPSWIVHWASADLWLLREHQAKLVTASCLPSQQVAYIIPCDPLPGLCDGG
jgi:hypothetical protein